MFLFFFGYLIETFGKEFNTYTFACVRARLGEIVCDIFQF